MSDFLQAAPHWCQCGSIHTDRWEDKGTAYSHGGGGKTNSFIFSSEKKAVVDNIAI